jgi:nuclear pore complex protein Nup210
LEVFVFVFLVAGEPLRCDVFVDQITKVEIETTTKELFLDDSPEEFVMRATNDKGKIFAFHSIFIFD